MDTAIGNPVEMVIENTAKVIGQTVRKVRPCTLCGTSEGVRITYAVPLDKGGEKSEWNHHVLCGPCRWRRMKKHLLQNTTESDLDMEWST